MPPYVVDRLSAYGGEVMIKSTDSDASVLNRSLQSPRYKLASTMKAPYSFFGSQYDSLSSPVTRQNPPQSTRIRTDCRTFILIGY